VVSDGRELVAVKGFSWVPRPSGGLIGEWLQVPDLIGTRLNGAARAAFWKRGSRKLLRLTHASGGGACHRRLGRPDGTAVV